jgi:hypothetical protein
MSDDKLETVVLAIHLRSSHLATTMILLATALLFHLATTLLLLATTLLLSHKVKNMLLLLSGKICFSPQAIYASFIEPQNLLFSPKHKTPSLTLPHLCSSVATTRFL